MMKIRTTHDPKPIPDRQFDWSAIDESTYDGAEDSSQRGMIGYGATEAAAIEDLERLFEERADYQQAMHEAECERRGVCGFGPTEAECRQAELEGLYPDEFAGGGMCFGPKP